MLEAIADLTPWGTEIYDPSGSEQQPLFQGLRHDSALILKDPFTACDLLQL